MAGVTGRLVLAEGCPVRPTQIAGLLTSLWAAGGHDGSGPAGLDGIGLQPLGGARNNRVYRWSAPGGAVCVKVYKVDDRRRADREWHALSLLAAHRIEGVPRPLWRLDDPRFPVVGMSLLSGRRLPERREDGGARDQSLLRGQAVPTTGFATVGAFDLPRAWLDQLSQHSRLVTPLRLRGSVSRSVVLERDNGHWTTRGSHMCTLMPRRGSADDPRSSQVAPNSTARWAVHRRPDADPADRTNATHHRTCPPPVAAGVSARRRGPSSKDRYAISPTLRTMARSENPSGMPRSADDHQGGALWPSRRW